MPFFFLKAKEVVPPTPPQTQTPLTFEITNPGYINWVCMGQDAATIEYKKNDGEWTSITALPFDEQTQQGATIDVVAGDVVQFRGDNDTYAVFDDGEVSALKGSFAFSTCGFELEGNIMSMINSTDYDNITTMTSDNIGAFAIMFTSCAGLTSAENLVLPATTLTEGCYSAMFRECSSLTSAPELPATTLANYCYGNMFESCRSLTSAPELPATTLANYCYGNMFEGCWSLTSAPELPATTLAEDCYNTMFAGCRSLTSAPELPATTLANYCYGNMFQNCWSLTSAPELPATTLADSCYVEMFNFCSSLTSAPQLPATTLAESCYSRMFYGCSSLNYIKCLATDISANQCTYDWVNNVAASGTFIKNPNMSSWSTGTSGIPTNWTVQDAS